jgi:hypothetical protein
MYRSYSRMMQNTIWEMEVSAYDDIHTIWILKPFKPRAR